MINKEIWKDVPSYEGLYQASNWGNVRSLNYRHTEKVKVLSPGISKDYLLLNLYKNGKKKQFLVHVLIYTSFNGPIPDGMTIDHINSIKSDNRLENLQLLSGADNSRKANNKSLVLTNACTSGKYAFPSISEANTFFGYKSESVIRNYIFNARKRGRNFITINKEKYYFILQ